MAKITTYIPEPSQEYSPENQRQVLQSLETLKDQLNFSFQEDLREEMGIYNWFLIGTGVRRIIKTKISDVVIVSGQSMTSNVGSVTVTIT
jgi:hypothetical protein